MGGVSNTECGANNDAGKKFVSKVALSRHQSGGRAGTPVAPLNKLLLDRRIRMVTGRRQSKPRAGLAPYDTSAANCLAPFPATAGVGATGFSQIQLLCR